MRKSNKESHKLYRISEKHLYWCFDIFTRLPYHLSKVDVSDVDFDNPDPSDFNVDLFLTPEMREYEAGKN